MRWEINLHIHTRAIHILSQNGAVFTLENESKKNKRPCPITLALQVVKLFTFRN